MTIAIGEVVSVKGVNVVLELYEESNKETLFYEGEKFKGVSIREHILIRRGFRDIVGLVQGEYLDERNQTEDGKGYVRKIELRPIGFYHEGEFYEGIKYLPMIRDVAYLMSEDQVKKIYGDVNDSFVVGNLLKEGLPISLPWERLFNTHIGVFGNTGSGKSNTLANLYTTLFTNKLQGIMGKSQFVVIDFNGEYTADQLLPRQEFKQVFDLDTKSDAGDKFPLGESEFWDSEVFGILFKATENTQKPFLKRVVSGRERFRNYPNSLTAYSKKVLSRALTSTSPKKEFAELMAEVASIIGADNLESKFSSLSWHGGQSVFISLGGWLNGGDQDATFVNFFKPDIDQLQIAELTDFNELKLRGLLKIRSVESLLC